MSFEATILISWIYAVPWDVADDFDMLVPGAPINGNDVLLYLPGHLAFFRNAPHIVDQFMTFPNLRTLDAYLNLPWISSDSGALGNFSPQAILLIDSFRGG